MRGHAMLRLHPFTFSAIAVNCSRAVCRSSAISWASTSGVGRSSVGIGIARNFDCHWTAFFVGPADTPFSYACAPSSYALGSSHKVWSIRRAKGRYYFSGGFPAS